jgi:hypothetical protein
MSNEPVYMEGPDEPEEQQTQQSSFRPVVHFRIKPQEISLYQRMADYFWRQGLIRGPSLHLLGRACLNIVANKWVRIEDQISTLMLQEG